jgi:phage gpG-like protein
MAVSIPREKKSSEPISRAQLYAAINGLQLHSVMLAWDFKPSIGIVAKAIDRLGVDIRSFREPLTRAIKQVMIPSFQANFDAGGRPDSWAELSEYSIKRRNGSSSPILVRTGNLRSVMRTLKIWTITPAAATIKSLPANVWYGNLMQAGFGGFGEHLQAATKSVGQGASAREKVGEAYSIMDTAKSARDQAKVFIPARPFVLLQDDDRDEIQQIFYLWLRERVAAVGRIA